MSEKDRGEFVKDGASSAQSAHGRYRIQTVAELTGVPASTLRAWEQRYGFPAPERTASAYRLYSDGDVARIVRVRALCDGGMAAAEAVAAVQAEAGAAAPSALAPSSLAPSSLAPSSLAPSSLAPSSLAPSSLAPSALVPASSRVPAPRRAAAPDPSSSIDLLELEARLRNALLMGVPRAAWAQTLAPAWSQIREAWLAGAIDRGEHRIATEILGHAARDLVRVAQPSAPIGLAFWGAFADDDDPVPACGAALALASAGLRMLSLGPRSSAGMLADAVARFAPRVIVLAVIEAPGTARARELVDDHARAAAGHALVLCGPGARELAPLASRHGVLVGDDDDVLAQALAVATP